MNIENWLLHKGISPITADLLIKHLPKEENEEPYIHYFTADYIMQYNDREVPKKNGYIEVGSTLNGTSIVLDVRDKSGAIYYLPIGILESLDDPRPLAIKVGADPDSFMKNSFSDDFPCTHWDAIKLLSESERNRIVNQIHYGCDEMPSKEELDKELEEAIKEDPDLAGFGDDF